MRTGWSRGRKSASGKSPDSIIAIEIRQNLANFSTSPMPLPSSPISRRNLFQLSGGIAGTSVFGATASALEEAPLEPDPAPGGATGEGERIGVLYQTPDGPWGSLQYYYFYLEAPPYLIEAVPLTNPRTRWAVPQREEAAFLRLIDEIEMADSSRAALKDPRNIGVADGIFAIFPPNEVLETLSPESRGTLYTYLETFPANPEIRDPVRIFSNSFQEWASDTEFPSDLVDRMSRMCYLRSGVLVFADISYLISQAKSEAEARVFQRHTSRVRTMLVRMDLKKQGATEELMVYWTTGLDLRRKQIAPLIDSGKSTPGVSGLDLVHILPPLARKLLYTYPDLSMAVEGNLPDCHWSALNFFNYNSQPIYLEESFAASSLLADFEMIDPPYRYGDLIVFVSENMSAYHTCVYLAADIVYSKNGRSLYQPWIILHLAEVEKLYERHEGELLRVQGFRKKVTNPPL